LEGEVYVYSDHLSAEKSLALLHRRSSKAPWWNWSNVTEDCPDLLLPEGADDPIYKIEFLDPTLLRSVGLKILILYYE